MFQFPDDAVGINDKVFYAVNRAHDLGASTGDHDVTEIVGALLQAIDEHVTTHMLAQADAIEQSRVTHKDSVEVFQGTDDKWYWRKKSGGNHSVIAGGGESFSSKQHAIRSAARANAIDHSDVVIKEKESE